MISQKWKNFAEKLAKCEASCNVQYIEEVFNCSNNKEHGMFWETREPPSAAHFIAPSIAGLSTCWCSHESKDGGVIWSFTGHSGKHPPSRYRCWMDVNGWKSNYPHYLFHENWGLSQDTEHLGWFQSPKDKPVSQARLIKIFTIIWIQKDPTGQDFMLSQMTKFLIFPTYLCYRITNLCYFMTYIWTIRYGMCHSGPFWMSCKEELKENAP